MHKYNPDDFPEDVARDYLIAECFYFGAPMLGAHANATF